MCHTPNVYHPWLTTSENANYAIFLSAVHSSSIGGETKQFLFKRLFLDAHCLEAVLYAAYNACSTAIFDICQPGDVSETQ